jgi:hypothetical protein
VRVLEATSSQIRFARTLKCGDAGESIAWSSCRWIHEQINLARQTRERSHHGAASVILNDQL